MNEYIQCNNCGYDQLSFETSSRASCSFCGHTFKPKRNKQLANFFVQEQNSQIIAKLAKFFEAYFAGEEKIGVYEDLSKKVLKMLHKEDVLVVSDREVLYNEPRD